LPIYPVAFLMAWMLSMFVDSAESVQALFRPLFVGVLLVVATQTALSLLLRDRQVAAVVLLLLELTVGGLVPLALAASILLAIALGIAASRGRPLQSLPWPMLTRGLNAISVIVLGLALVTAVLAGALTPPENLLPSARGPVPAGAPDIYLVLLDAYPRSDTLATQFGYDNEPFLAEMRGLGFDVATHSHSNYNATALTLASMLNMSQVANLAEEADPPSSLQAQSRALSRAINQGRGVDALRANGYEIVTIPTEVSAVTMYGADQILDSGQLTSFEVAILQSVLPPFILDLQGPWLIGTHRDRVMATLDRVGQLAAQRIDHPRFVFAHILAPHSPIAFGPAGEPRSGWQCFPSACSMLYGGQGYGNAVLAPIRDEVEYLNTRVVDVARQIMANSARPPVIIFFSDHGSRHDYNDRDEMLRSIFIAATPGHPNLFPADVTPINIIPRLLNTYAATHLSMATEESYILGAPTNSSGVQDLTPWNIDPD
jgi:hypothetical protein